MYAVVSRDGHVVGPRVQHVEGRFRLGQKMVPLVDGEVGMGARENGSETSGLRVRLCLRASGVAVHDPQ